MNGERAFPVLRRTAVSRGWRQRGKVRSEECAGVELGAGKRSWNPALKALARQGDHREEECCDSPCGLGRPGWLSGWDTHPCKACKLEPHVGCLYKNAVIDEAGRRQIMLATEQWIERG